MGFRGLGFKVSGLGFRVRFHTVMRMYIVLYGATGNGAEG